MTDNQALYEFHLSAVLPPSSVLPTVWEVFFWVAGKYVSSCAWDAMDTSPTDTRGQKPNA